mmetsp:Transcript_2979/g.6186  ORF Transcript_2979/g.6186 Transcript_2979/m.6186 type:complete len:309 (+) Transcript_2979:1203-2129(+)
MLPSSTGTVPVKLLNCNHNCCMPVRYPSSTGRVPVNLLYASESEAKEVMFPNHEYKGPVRPGLPSAQNSLRANDPSNGDRSPTKKLSLRCKNCKSGSSLNMDGMLVLSKLPSRLRYINRRDNSKVSSFNPPVKKAFAALKPVRFSGRNGMSPLKPVSSNIIVVIFDPRSEIQLLSPPLDRNLFPYKSNNASPPAPVLKGPSEASNTTSSGHIPVKKFSNNSKKTTRPSASQETPSQPATVVAERVVAMDAPLVTSSGLITVLPQGSTVKFFQFFCSVHSGKVIFSNLESLSVISFATALVAKKMQYNA